MIIDFHTHIFPDKVAKPAIDKLKEYLKEAGEIDVAYTEGTIDSLIESMKKSGIDMCVTLPVVTDPKQFESINLFSSLLKEKYGIIPFGGIHPDNDNVEEKLEYIKSLGLKGIKLHPDYQNTYINDEKYIKILRHCEELGLVSVIHSGYDVMSPDDKHCSIDRAIDMLEKVTGGRDNKIVLAHMGDMKDLEYSYERLCGKNVYLDTSYMFNKCDESFLIKMFEKHSFDKILFASDSPWGEQKAFVEILEKLDISDENREKIAHQNAEHLLALKV